MISLALQSLKEATTDPMSDASCSVAVVGVGDIVQNFAARRVERRSNSIRAGCALTQLLTQAVILNCDRTGQLELS